MAVKRCYCENAFQDEKYGKGMRVCNKTANGYRCTVCGKDIESQRINKDQNNSKPK